VTRLISAVGLALLLRASAPAAEMGPTSQTLDAMRGEAVSNPDLFFDGMDSRVTSPLPVYYAPLPAVPATMPGDTSFDSRRIAPGLTLHRPVPASKGSGSSSMGTVLMFALGAALVAAAVLLLLFL
jgi:hypothetical protein